MKIFWIVSLILRTSGQFFGNKNPQELSSIVDTTSFRTPHEEDEHFADRSLKTSGCTAAHFRGGFINMSCMPNETTDWRKSQKRKNDHE